MPALIRSRRPEPESPVNMNPGSRALSLFADLPYRVKCPRVYIACLKDCQSQRVKPGHLSRNNSSLAVLCKLDYVALSESQNGQGLKNCCMGFFAEDNFYRWRFRQAF